MFGFELGEDLLDGLGVGVGLDVQLLEQFFKSREVHIVPEQRNLLWKLEGLGDVVTLWLAH